MKLRSIGSTHQPSVAILGVFDPILPAHLDLFAEVREYARQRDLHSLVMLIDPDPGSFMSVRSDWPVFHDRETRIRLILESGIDGVLLLRFSRKDLVSIAADFFEAVVPLTNVVELWLGARQHIGSGPESSWSIVEQIAIAHRIILKRLPPVDLKKTTRDVRLSLSNGSVQRAFAMTGQFPQRVRPRTGTLRLAWHPGHYLALATSADGVPAHAKRLKLELINDGRRMSRMAWPDAQISRLTFVVGPADARTHQLPTETRFDMSRGIPGTAAISSAEGGVTLRG